MKKIFFSAFLITFAAASCASAEIEEADRADTLLNYDVIYAEVSAVDKDAGTITLLEYDYQEDQEVYITYNVSEDTEFQEVENLGGVKIGDWVDLDYCTDSEGKKTAVFIAVEVEPVFEE